MRATLPDDSHLPHGTELSWTRQRRTMEHLANWRWWLGDFLLAAPTNEKRADFLNNTPTIEPIEASALRTCAKAFPPERRNPNVTWQHHWAVHKLPPDIADHLLRAAARNTPHVIPVRDIERAAKLQATRKT